MSDKLQHMGTLPKLWSQISKRPLVRDTIVTTVLSTAGKAVGFLIPFFIAAWFGVTGETDAFFFAYGLVVFLTQIFASVVESIIVPFIAEIKANNEAEIKTFLGSTLMLATGGLALLGIVFLIVAKPLLTVVTRFPPESIELTFLLLAETVPLLVLLVGTSLLSGALNAYRLFWLPATSPAFRALLTLFVIYLFKDKIGVHSIAAGYVVGEGFRFLILSRELFRRGILSFKISNVLNPKLLEFLKITSYQVIGMVAIAFNPIVDKTMASWLGPGYVSILEYADRLYQIPMNLISQGLFVVLLSHWSDDFYQGNEGVFKSRVINTAMAIGGGVVLLSLTFILLRYPLVNLVYGYGKFPRQYLPQVTAVWGLYLIGLAPTIFGLIFARAHMVWKNTRTLMNLGILNCIMHVLLNLILIGPFGIYGLALSTVVTYSLVSIGLYVTFLRSTIA